MWPGSEAPPKYVRLRTNFTLRYVASHYDIHVRTCTSHYKVKNELLFILKSPLTIITIYIRLKGFHGERTRFILTIAVTPCIFFEYVWF